MPICTFYILQLKLSNYKSYSFKEFNFSEKLNFIVGNNGIGKTNLLDAVYYSCLSKSYFSSDLMVPNFQNVFFRIESNISLGIDNQLVEFKYLKQEKKEISLNKVKVEKLTSFVGKYPCVFITPDDNQLILGASEIRRKFIDATLCQFSSDYLLHLVSYNKVLAQRNALLKSFYEKRTFDNALLDVYNQQMVQAGNFIHQFRKEFMLKFVPVFEKYYRQIFDGDEQIDIHYHSDLLDNDYATLLQTTQEQDRVAQRTTKGIHLDDIVFEMKNFPLKKIASQGQQKTVLLSMKLAQFELLKIEKQVMPLLLLDDIFDKLDSGRITKIFQLIKSESFGQVFISDTDIDKIQQLIENNNCKQYKIIPLG